MNPVRNCWANGGRTQEVCNGMNNFRTRSLENIEEKIQSVEENSLRYQILKSAKSFKTSWIELGRALYTVWKDKLYKEWGYGSIEAYTSKEIGIRKQTAMKLLRSYYFLEKEEPDYLRGDYCESHDAALVPSYESIDVLRQAKNKKEIEASDYANLKKEIFEKGKDAREVKKGLTAFIRERKELASDEAREGKKFTVLKRFLSALKSLKRELEISKLASFQIVKEADNLIKKIESEINT